MLMSLWNPLRRGAEKLLRDEDGAGVVEMIISSPLSSSWRLFSGISCSPL